MAHTFQLSNGVRVAAEPLDSVRSVSLGFYLELGSRDENPDECGYAHIIEHMFFKGTALRDTERLSNEINKLGGHTNAYTSQDSVCLHTRVVDSKLEQGVELLADMLCHPEFPPDELERERNVILEEISMYEDTPDEQVVDNFTEALWRDSALGRPVLGTRASVAGCAREGLLRFCGKHFSTERMLVTVVGHFEIDRLRDLLERHLADFETGSRPRQCVRPESTYTVLDEIRPGLEQTHFCVGSEAIERAHPDRFAYGLMNFILGGGMSSRIVREVREKRGMAYSIYSYHRGYVDTGYFIISGGTRPENLEEVFDTILRETRRMYEEPVGQEELDNAREAVVDSMLLGMESTNARMGRLADSVLYFDRIVPVEEVLEKLNSVTVRDVQAAAEQHLRGRDATLCSIGPKAFQVSAEEGVRF